MAIKKYIKIILWVLVIGVLCFTPGNEFKEVKINIPHFDKIVHFGMFYILGLLIKANNKISNAHYISLIIVSVVYAAIIELIQHYFVFMRNGDIVDFIADIVGLVSGILTIGFYPRILRNILK